MAEEEGMVVASTSTTSTAGGDLPSCPPPLTKENDWVVLYQIHRKSSTLVQLKPNSFAKIGKRRVAIDALVGVPYGSLFTVAGGKNFVLSDDYSIFEDVAEDVITPASDNRAIFDKGDSNQKLGYEDILSMRKDGASGKAIIDSLVENSVSFKAKTEFSRQKYLDKKTDRHLQTVLLKEANAKNVCEALFERAAVKICCLRVDALALILYRMNLRPHTEHIVVDGTRGLMSAAVAERLGGFGKVFSVHIGLEVVATHEDLVTHGKPHLASAIHHVSLEDIIGNVLPSGKHSLPMMAEGSANSLTIVTRYAPEPLLFSLLPYVAPSSPFVVFCASIEPLSDLYVKLIKSGVAIRLRLTDTFMREYQVLTSRTHPLMNMHMRSGYILSGTLTDAPMKGDDFLEYQPRVKRTRTVHHDDTGAVAQGPFYMASSSSPAPVATTATTTTTTSTTTTSTATSTSLASATQL